MHRSSSRRSPPPSRPRATGGVILESVETFRDGRPVATQIFTSAETRPSTHHAPSRSQTVASSSSASHSKAVVRASSTRHPNPAPVSSRGTDYSVPGNSTTTKKIVYTYPEPPRPVEPRHHTRKPSVEPVPRGPPPVSRSGRGYLDEGRSRGVAQQDDYSYTSARDMYETTEPKSSRIRRGSVDAAATRERERASTALDSFPPAGRPSARDGPPPTTRGLDRINDGAGISRHSSLRDSRRHSPPRRTREPVYGSDDDMAPRFKKATTMPVEALAYDRSYPIRDAYDDRRPARRLSPPEERRADRSVERRGFGVRPGASDYRGYAREEAPLGPLPPPSALRSGPQEPIDPRDYLPEVVQQDRRRDYPSDPRDALRQQNYEDDRGYDRRQGQREPPPRHDYDDASRGGRSNAQRRYRDDEGLYEDDYDTTRDRRQERQDYPDNTRRDRNEDIRRTHRDELAAGAEAALAAGGAAYGVNAIRKERDEKERRGPPERDPRVDPRDDEPRRHRNAEREPERPQERETREPERNMGAPPERARPAQSPPDTRDARPALEPESPEQPRHRSYVTDNDASRPDGPRSPPAVAADPDEEYRRRLEQEAQRLSAPAGPPPAREDNSARDIPGGYPRDEPPPDSRNRYIPPDARPKPIEGDEPADSLILARTNPPAFSTNPIYTEPHNDPSLAVPPDPDRPDNRVRIIDPTAPKGILRKPTAKFPDHPPGIREGVAPLDKEKAKTTGAPPDAKWTKIDRRLVNPDALDEAQERYEERDECVIVLRVLSKEEIQTLADRTKELRDARYERRRRKGEGGNEEDRPKQIGWSGDDGGR